MPTYLDDFQQSLKIARKINADSSEIRILINSIKIEKRIQKNHLFTTKFKLAQILLERLPDSPLKLYTIIELAKLSPIPQDNYTKYGLQCSQIQYNDFASSLLHKSVTIAHQLKDRKSTSLALGNLAQFYECNGDYSLAIKLTQQAIDELLKIPDTLYLWQWQIARIQELQGKKLAALASYKGAVTTLKSILGFAEKGIKK